MVDEWAIRTALEQIANTAPLPDRVFAHITARSRSMRRRQLLLGALGAAGFVGAAAAIGVPVAESRRRIYADQDKPGLPIGWAPSWLPAGTTEVYRSVKLASPNPNETSPTATSPNATSPNATSPDTTGPNATGPSGTGPSGTSSSGTSSSGTSSSVPSPNGGTRVWMPHGDLYTPNGSGITFSVNDTIDDDAGDVVLIGSTPGRLRVTNAAYLTWQPENQLPLLVCVYGLANVEDLAVRVAESVAPSTVSMPVTADAPWVPDRYVGGGREAAVFPTANGWRQELTCATPDRRQRFTVIASTEKPDEPAYSVARLDGVTSWIPSAGLVTGPEATRILERFRFAAPDLSWAH